MQNRAEKFQRDQLPVTPLYRTSARTDNTISAGPLSVLYGLRLLDSDPCCIFIFGMASFLFAFVLGPNLKLL